MHRNTRMTPLELRHLKRFCYKYEIDIAEIDNSLTYYENLQHLKEIAKRFDRSGELLEMERMVAEQERYMAEHPLTYYASFQFGDKTLAEIKAEQKERQRQIASGPPQQFSLKKMEHIGFSLRTFINHKG